MKLFRTLATLVSSLALAFGLMHFGYSLRVAAKLEAEGVTWAAHHNRIAEQHIAMQKYLELEAKRTTVQREIRSMVIAELQRCKKSKARGCL